MRAAASPMWLLHVEVPGKDPRAPVQQLSGGGPTRRDRHNVDH